MRISFLDSQELHMKALRCVPLLKNYQFNMFRFYQQHAPYGHFRNRRSPSQHWCDPLLSVNGLVLCCWWT